MPTGWGVALVKAIEGMPGQVIWGDRDPYLPANTTDRFGEPVPRFFELSH